LGSLGHNGGPPLVEPRRIVLPQPPRPKDKRDKKRRKPLRETLKGAFSFRKVPRTFNERVKAMQAREKVIGLPPKYRNRRSQQEPQAAWEAKAKAFRV
jgi:hypothetical protein